MSSTAPENRPPEGTGPEQGHVSFIQRLHRRFGEGVDPEINLEGETRAPEGEARTPAPGSGSSAPATSKDLVERLHQHIEVGPRYSIKDEVARGGMGTILRVWDEDLRRNLAMKVMHGRGVAGDESGSGEVDQERLGRFLEEAQITGQLDHPGVVPVHDLGIDSKGRCYFTMRFVRGRELKDVLDLAREGKEGWTRTKALGVVLKVCEAMAYAHSKGVVHRDLKPSNVMVGRFGEAYLMDWGLARVVGRRDSHDLRIKSSPQDQTSLSLVKTVRREEGEANPSSTLVTMDGDVIGTPSYMSPEQAQGKLEEVGPRSDVYSLGAILYSMLTGQAPYVKPGERVSPHTVLSRVLGGPPTPVEKLARNEPAELIAICEKAMARDPAQRYAGMMEVADDIQAYLENRVVRAYEGGSLAEFRKWVARNRGMAAGIAGMVTLSIASALGFAWQKQRQIEDVRKKEAETALAKDAAVENLQKAEQSEKEAKANLDLAVQRQDLADRSALIARESEERARRASYMANVLAADYSLKLNDVAEARERMDSSDVELRGWEWRHLDKKANGALKRFEPLTVSGGVDAVAFHPDETRVIVFTAPQGKVFLYDVETRLRMKPENMGFPTQVSQATLTSLFSSFDMDVSRDGSRIALVGRDQDVLVYDAFAGEILFPEGLQGHAARVTAVAFSLNGRFLASGDESGSIQVWDAQSGEPLQRLAGHGATITNLAWSPHSDRLASASTDGTARVWDSELGQGLLTLRGAGEAYAVAWDLRGETLFSAGEDRAINQWDVRTGQLVQSFAGHQGAVLALAYDPGARKLASGSLDETVRVWDVATGAMVVLHGHEDAVQDVAFSPGGDLILSGSRDGIVYLWDSRGDLSTTELVYHRLPVHAVAYDPRGERIVTAGGQAEVQGSQDGELVLWDAQRGEPLRRLRGHEGPITSVVFDREGRRVLSGSLDKTARLWDAETGRLLKTYAGHEKWIYAVAITPDGTRVITGSGDRKVRIIDAELTEVLHELSGHRYAVRAIAVSPDGARIATAGRDVLIWDLGGALGAADLVLNTSSSVHSLAFSPDGTRLVTGSSAGQVQIWDLATGTAIATVVDPSRKQVGAVAFAPDGTRIATGSTNGTIRVRDGATGDSYLALAAGGPGDDAAPGVTSLAFSPDGARLLAGDAAGGVRIFETEALDERRLRTREAAALVQQADRIVDDLFAELFFLEQVLLRLEGDRELERPLQECALRRAHLRGDDPGLLFARSLADAMVGGQSDEVYERALERAQTAERMDVARSVTNPARQQARARANDWTLALGAASFRTQRYEESLDFLQTAARVDRDRSALGERDETIRQLFLCMTQARMDQDQEARASLASAANRALGDPELETLLAEAEDLVGHTPPAGS